MQNNYLFFKYSLSNRIVGKLDGVSQFYGADDVFLAKNAWYAKLLDVIGLSSVTEMTAVAQEVVEWEIDPLAKLTDIMIGGIWFGRGIFVNEKAKAVISKEACLPNHKFVKSTFLHNGTIVKDYWWLVIDLETGEHTMNFPACEFNFQYTKYRDAPIKPAFNSYQEYVSFTKTENFYPGMDKLVFNKNFDRSLDIWSVRYISRLFISERLDKILKKNKIRGYDANNGGRFAPKLIFE